MRRLVAVAFATLTALYVLEAYRFLEQERWALHVPESMNPERLRHPEANIALARENLGRFRYRRREQELIERALAATPAFYEPPFLLATFHATRLEKPDTVLAGYELAVKRFPVNGRLRLAYGTWLLRARENLDVWRRIGDPLESAEAQLKAAMELEPELTPGALDALSEARVPIERWTGLVPDDPVAQNELLAKAFRSGRFDLIFDLSNVEAEEDLSLLRRVAESALRAARPDIAVDASLRWLTLAEKEHGPGRESFAPAASLFRAHLARGDESTADETFAATQARIEATHGASSLTSVEFLCVMGEHYLRADRVLSAESVFGEARLRRPSHVRAILGLARCAERHGDVESSELLYREVLRLEPENNVAQRALEAQSLLRSRGRSGSRRRAR